MKRSRAVTLTMAAGLLSITCSLPATVTRAATRTVILAPSDEQNAAKDEASSLMLTPHVPAASTVADHGLATHARSAVVMDYATGKVLYNKDPHEQLPMASITKIMTMLLIMEAVDAGKLKLSDTIRTSEYAASMGGSQIFLEPGEIMSVRDMMKGIAVASANDACVAMAEHLCGTEGAFVAKMNDRARSLGMKDTHFANCNGLPAPNHYSSAYDIAIMSRALLQHSEITQWTSVYSDYLRKDTDSPLWLVNTNKLVRFYPGVDGLKTGYTSQAKYCLSATAKKKDGFRVIAVVMGEPKPTVRNAEVSGLLNWAFSQYESHILYQKGDRIAAAIPVSRGTPKTVDGVAGDVVGVVYGRGTKPDYDEKLELNRLTAPIKAGQVIGKFQVYEGDELVAEVPVVAKAEINRVGFWKLMGRIITFGAAN